MTTRKPLPATNDDASEDAAEFLFRHSDAICLCLDASGRIRQANAEAGRILGYPQDKLARMQIGAIRPALAGQGWAAYRDTLQRRRRTVHSDTFRPCSDEPFTAEIVAVAFGNGEARRYYEAARPVGGAALLYEGDESFRATLDHTYDCVFMFEPDTLRFFYVNSGVTDQIGYSREEMLRMTPYDIKPEYSEETFRALIAPLTCGRRDSVRFQTVHRHRDGHDVPVEVFLQYVARPGYAPRFVAIARDLSERREMDLRISANEERLRQAARLTTIGIYDHNHVTDALYWSPEQRRIFGWGEEEPVTTQDFLGRLHPEDAERVAAAMRESHDPRGSGIFSLEHRIVRRDGEVRWLSEQGQTFFEGQGKARRAVRTVGADLDITERKRAERHLEFMQAAIDSSETSVFWQDETGAFTYVNRYACETLGYEREELLGRYPWEFLDYNSSGEDWPRHWSDMQEQKVVTFETRHWRKDGSSFPVEVTANYFVFDEQPQVFVFAKDITARLAAEQALRVSEERLKEAMRVAAVGVFDRTLSEESGYWAPELRRILGVDEDDPAPIGRFFEGIVPADRERVLALRAAALDPEGPGGFDCDFRWQRPDGRVRWLTIRSRTVFRGSGRERRADRTVGAILDITEQKRAEQEIRELNEALEARVAQRTRELEQAHEQILRQEKLSVLGQVTATVSHELRNPLGTIRSSVYLIDAKIRDRGFGVEAALDRVERNVMRCDRIIQELLDFTRTQPLKLEDVDVDAFVREFLDEVVLPPGIRLETSLRAGLRVHLEPERLRQCLLNVVNNALEAMTAADEPREREAVLSVATAVDEGTACIIVRDTGPGIPEAEMSKIFEPLYSTKGFGVGMGLVIVRQIMKQHHGRITIESREGEGTRVLLTLPIPQ